MKIYGFADKSADWLEGDVVGHAISEDGQYLASHISSSEAWAKQDLLNHYRGRYDEAFGDGQWEFEFVLEGDRDTHKGLTTATEQYKLLNRAGV